MRLADYSAGKRRELVALALSVALQDLQGPVATIEIVRAVGKRLESDELRLIGRMITDWAPRIPEAERAGHFKQYGREFTRWQWWPKGWTKEGQTRQAKREARTDLIWRGVAYADADALSAAKAAAEWEVEL